MLARSVANTHRMRYRHCQNDQQECTLHLQSTHSHASSSLCTRPAHLCEVQPLRVHDEALRAAQHAQADRGLCLESGGHRAAALAQVVRPRQVDRGVVLLSPHQLQGQKQACRSEHGSHRLFILAKRLLQMRMRLMLHAVPDQTTGNDSVRQSWS